METNNMTRMSYEGKELLLIGTAHVSKHSADEVRSIIRDEQPDTVCIELDKDRYDSIINEATFKDMDIIKIIKQKKTAIVLVNVLLGSYQKRIAQKMEINAGQEMMVGIEEAKACNATLVLADRKIQTTFIRVWRNHTLWQKCKLMMDILMEAFSDDDISEDDLERLKQSDVLSAALHDISTKYPKFAESLIFERDAYLAHKIKTAPGKKIVAICGAAHIQGIIKEIPLTQDMEKLDSIPAKSKLSSVLAWGIPLFIIAMIIISFGFDSKVGMSQLKSWILWTGTLSALGSLLAFAHPLSILVSFVVAPFSALNPVLAAGWFAGLCEAYLRKPRVSDFENLSDDVATFRGFFKNRVIHIILVVILCNLLTSIGSIVSGLDIFQSFFQFLK